MAAALTRVSRDPGGIVRFAIFLAGAFVAAYITGFAFGLVGAAIWKVVLGLLLASGVALLTAWR